MSWARGIKTGSPTVKAVLLAISNYADEEGICWPSQEQLADDTELSRHTIMRALDELEDRGALSRERRHRGDGSRTTDLIILDLNCTHLSSTELRSTEQRSSQQRSTQQQPKSHGATAVIEPSSEPSKDISRRAKVSKADEELAFEAWNDLAAVIGLPKAMRLNDPRRKALRLRLIECGGLDGWFAALEKIRGSPFLRGENDKGWQANFDFVLQASSFTRLMEGVYDRSKPQGSAVQRPNSRENNDRILARIVEEARLRENGESGEDVPDPDARAA